MVRVQLQGRGIRSQAVLEAFARVPRHLFVASVDRPSAYADYPLPIGAGQTISQPYVVAYMLEQLRLAPADRVLEIGTGSGYQTALLAELVAEVFTIERVEALAASARPLLDRLGYRSVRLCVGDGTAGWDEHAPYDAIVGAAAAAQIPAPLLRQLRLGGRMILPVGSGSQQLVLVERLGGEEYAHKELLPVRFVPMIGDH